MKTSVCKSRAKWLRTRAAIAVSMLCALSSRASAHPIHTTLTKVTISPYAITFNVRAFADDFSATVAKFAGRKAPADSSAPATDVQRYLQTFFTAMTEGGKSLAIESCGVRRANELYWLCFKVAMPAGTKGVRVRNQMLTELHADQVNIVQLEPPATRRTILFTKGSAYANISE